MHPFLQRLRNNAYENLIVDDYQPDLMDITGL